MTIQGTDKEFSCRDVGMDCDFKIKGQTEDELFQRAEQHARDAHGISNLTDEMKNKIRQAVGDKSQAA